MEESTTYQLILSRGEIKGKRELILRLGRKKLGEPSESQLREVEGIQNADRLARLADAIFDVTSWQELLDSP